MMAPQTEAELAEMIKSANGPISVRGGGTRGMTTTGEALTTSGLSGVSLYEPGALTLVAQAGTPLAEIESVLADQNQRLAFEPMDHRALLGTTGTPTIGGVVAANVSGPRRIQAGAARDFALGVRFVDGAGSVVKNGGRVMKNVTGYDLVKLMCGAHGTLGVLSEVSLKVLPMPEDTATLVLHGLAPSVAVQAMSAALGSPFDVTGAAHRPNADQAASETMIRLEGFSSSVAYRCAELKERLSAFGAATVLDNAQSAAAWMRIRDVKDLAAEHGDVWRVSVKPTDGPRVLDAIGICPSVMDWAGGLVWLVVPEGTDVRAKLVGIAGHATLVRSSTETRNRFGVFQPESGSVAALSAGLRSRFDPRAVLNAGLMEQAA